MIWISFGGLLAVIGTFRGLVLRGGLAMVFGPQGPPLMISSAFCLSFLGSYLILSMIFSKVILRPDAVEVQNLFSSRTMLRGEIRGQLDSYITHFDHRTLPRDTSQRKLKIAFFATPDSLFAAWFSSIPDLDAAELAESATQIPATLSSGLRRSNDLNSWQEQE